MKELYKNEQGNYCFEFNGVSIENPTMSEDYRYKQNPEYYGFQIWSTGGGCTGHGQLFKLKDKTVLMLLTDTNLNHIDEDTVEVSCGLYDENMDECFYHVYL
jgi:hypothetical protein